MITVGDETTLLAGQNNSFAVESQFRRTFNYQSLQKKGLFKKIKTKPACGKSIVYDVIPILKWLPHYDFRSCLLGDLVAGLTVSVLQIPHGLAFAPLGGQEPVVGLYMAVFPVLMYVIFGTSKHLSLGMQAILIMMVGKVVKQHSIESLDITNGTVQGYTSLEVGIACTFTVGLWQILLGFARLGILSVLLSDSLVSGLTSGASVHIIFIQLKHILGIQGSMTTGPLKLIFASIELAKNLIYTNYVALGISSAVMLALLIFNDYLKPILAKKSRIPIPLEFILIALGILLSEFLNLKDNYNVNIVGVVPSGMPEIVIPPMNLLPAIALDSLVIALVNISINVSLAKVFARKGGYEINENQELVAYGISNMFGGFFQCLPICAALSRSIIQFSVGGKTEMAHVFSLLSVWIMLLFLGPIFGKVPFCVLAAIVIISVRALFMQVKELPVIWRSSRLDGLVWLTTFISVILVDIDYGIGIGLAASVLSLVINSIQYEVVVLGEVEDAHRFVDVRYYPCAKTASRVLTVKVCGAINFVNSAKIFRAVEKCIDEFLAKIGNNSCDAYALIDFGAVHNIDPTGVQGLLTLQQISLPKNCSLALADCSPTVYENLEKCSFFNSFPEDSVFITVDSALKYLK